MFKLLIVMLGMGLGVGAQTVGPAPVKVEKEPAAPAAKPKTTTVVKKDSGITWASAGSSPTTLTTIKTYDEATGKLLVEVHLNSWSVEPSVWDYTQHPMVSDEYDTLEHAQAAAKKIVEKWESRISISSGCVTLTPGGSTFFGIPNTAQ